jgi:hypothetical protein
MMGGIEIGRKSREDWALLGSLRLAESGKDIRERRIGEYEYHGTDSTGVGDSC